MKLVISKPCQQIYGQMSPCSDGRFCKTCQNTVIDFTNFTDAQLRVFFNQNNKKICGRLHPGQINVTLNSKDVNNKKSPVLSACLLGLGFTLLSPTAEAQIRTQDSAITTQPLPPKVSLAPLPVLQNITGRIISTSGEVVVGAAILLPGTSTGTTSDSNGNFALKIPESLQSAHIQVQIAAIGFQSQLISVPVHNPGITVTLVPDLTTLLGEVCVVGGITAKRTFWQRITRWFRK